jgi:hypothetical protein
MVTNLTKQEIADITPPHPTPIPSELVCSVAAGELPSGETRCDTLMLRPEAASLTTLLPPEKIG